MKSKNRYLMIKRRKDIVYTYYPKISIPSQKGYQVTPLQTEKESNVGGGPPPVI